MSLPIAPKGLNATSITVFSANVGTLFQVINGPVILRGWSASNCGAFLQFFNKLSANVTLGTTVPDFVILGDSRELRVPLIFDKGLTLASTTTRGGLTVSSQEVNIFHNVP